MKGGRGVSLPGLEQSDDGDDDEVVELNHWSLDGMPDYAIALIAAVVEVVDELQRAEGLP